MTRLFTCLLLLWFAILPTIGKSQSAGGCHTDMKQVSPAMRQLMAGLNRNDNDRRARLAAAPLLECRVAVDIDNTLFSAFDGNYDQIRQYVYYTMNEVSTVFERELNVRLTVTYVKIWDAPDPYRQTTESNGHLNALYNWWNLNLIPTPYDIVLGYTAKFSGGRALLGTTKGLGYCGIVGAAANNLSVATTAHEIGHLFGSVHTHDCSWPGGPIDHCATLEGTCPPEQDRYDLGAEVGTIMSYCQSALTFHPLCRDVMRTVVDAAGRFTPMNALPPAPAVPTAASLFTSDNPALNWSATLRTNQYRLQLAADSTFGRVVTDTLLPTPQYRSYPLTTDIGYYWRVAAVNTTAGTGPWSAMGRFRCVSTGALPAPTLRRPVLWAKGVTDDNMVWYPVAGSTRYQLQFSQTPDVATSTVLQSLLTTSTGRNSIDTPDYPIGLPDATIYWRVRAEKNGVLGPWSDVSLFKRAPRALTVRPKLARDYVGSIPIGWAISSEPNVRSTVELATLPNFEKIISRQTALRNEVGSYPATTAVALFDSLADATSYYYRIQESTADGTGPYTYGQISTETQRPAWHYINSANSPLPSSGHILAKPQPDGSLWVITESALYYRKADQKTWVAYKPDQLGSRLTGMGGDLLVDRAGTVWLATNRSLLRLVNGTWQKIPYPFTESTFVNKLLTDGRGALFVLTTGKGVLRYANGAWTQYSEPAYATLVPAGTVDNNGILWAIMGQQIGRFDGTNWTFVDNRNSNLSIQYINKLAIDSTGTRLCVAGGNQLATRDATGNWTSTSLDAINHGGGFINTVVYDRQNRLTVLSQTNIHRWTGQTWAPIEDGFLTSAEGVADLTVGADNRYWVSAAYTLPGISIYDGRTVRLSAPPRSVYCAGDSIALRVTSDVPIRPGVTYAMQLRLPNLTYSAIPARLVGDSVRVQLPANAAQYNSYGFRLTLPDLNITGNQSGTFAVNRRPAGAIIGSLNRAYCANETVPLSATADAGTYQWLLNGAPVPGSTSLTYAPTQSGVYALSVTAGGCSAVTSAVSLTMNPAPVATAAPQSATQTYGSTAVTLLAGGGGAYQWLNGVTPIAGATAATYDAPSSGQYAVQVTNATGCTAVSAPVRVEVQAPLAVEALPDYELTVSPNPTADAVVVQYQLTRWSDVVMTLTDGAGRIVQTQSWPGQSAATHRHTLTMPPSAGTYMLTLHIGDQRISRKLIRQ